MSVRHKVLVLTIGQVLLGLCISATAFDVRGQRADVKGRVVDEQGNLAADVALRIIVTELVDLEPSRYETNIIVNGQFRLEFPSVAELDVIASKTGYVDARAHFNRSELTAEDVVLELVAAPAPTRLVQVKAVELRLSYGGQGTGVLLDEAQLVGLDDDPDLRFALPESWSPTNGLAPPYVSLVAGNGTGLAPVASQDQTYSELHLAACVRAPSEGYVSKVEFAANEPAGRLLYFRTAAGHFGKLQVRILQFLHSRQEIFARIEYFLQPDGSTNLHNTERLKLIKAKSP